VSAMAAVSIANVRYRQLGADPVARQLYAVLVAAVRAAGEAEVALRQYLDAQ